ncbi:alpha/beta hydrolase [Pseudonocardia ailaonensis]|uniref:Alpha/beta hydrolase n=1 Tax=Pseudonocardia ailaonensis TaxID=367279 RepID=A0ABN2NFY4_9PSEU
MRRWGAVLFLFVLLAGCSSGGSGAGSAGGGLDGDWHGTLKAPSGSIDLGLHFTGTAGTVDIPSQGVSGAPLASVTHDGDTVAFALKDVPGNPAYQGTLAGDTISGTFTQSGASLPLELTRGALPAAARPQEPKPPYPYRSEDVTFPGAGVTLAGTVTAPNGPGPFPGVVMITGSGAQDRDETLAGHKPFLLLADTLTRAGFAVLRTDDRGVGGSGGDLTSASYDALAGDALAEIAFLKSRPDVDKNEVGLFGHSEGGYIAPLAAQKSPAEVAFAVLMAGPSVPGPDVLIEQNRLILGQAGATPPQIDGKIADLDAIIARVRAGDLAGASQLATDQATEAGATADQAKAAGAQIAGLQYFLTYDPAPALRSLTIPVFAFFGGKDLQVPAAQNEGPMTELLAGDPKATVRTFPGLNHLMQPASTGAPSEYGTIPTTIDPTVLDAITAWTTTL